ncbi:MAG TPA: DUF1345 domain-containing protein [Aquabacterium sp.]|nr:DUF1345 domain-containing protein [Aquabacterium sp.]
MNSTHRIPGLHQIHRLVRMIRVRPRLAFAALLGAASAFLLPEIWPVRPVTRLIVGWNIGAWLYLVLAAQLMSRSEQADVSLRARQQDEGAVVILSLVVVAALVSLGSIVAELAVAKNLVGWNKLIHIGLAAMTILSSWAFTQVMFAFHYAHDFYVAQHRGGSGGLDFPGTPQPRYIDFLYFSAVIGTSGQTADVSVSSTHMRKVTLVHCVLAFLFNTSLIALLINVASGLLS